MLDVGDVFPEFSLQDQNGDAWTRDRLKGHKCVVYFYPKDDTTGCTAEACGFRDLPPDVPGALVIGVSPDDVASHKKFAEKYGLNFVLLADPGKELIEPLGLWVEKAMYGRNYMGVSRTTYLLDENAVIRQVFRNVKPQGHAQEVRDALVAVRA